MLTKLHNKTLAICKNVGRPLIFIFFVNSFILINFFVEAQNPPPSYSSWMVKVKGNNLPLGLKLEHVKVKSQLRLPSPSDSSKIITIHSVNPTQTQNWLTDLLEKGEIEYFEPDYIGTAASRNTDLPNDPLAAQQWYLNNDGTLTIWKATANADVNIPEAWAITQGNENIIIAILDSGVSFSEPDLAGRLWTNIHEIPGDLLDNDQNGYVDDEHGYDFINNKSIPQDDNGHGTGIAGIIGAATNNSIGVSGINPNAKLMICKVLNNTLSGNYSNWIEGIHYAIANGADIINMSVTGKDDSKLLQEAIQYAFANDVAIFTSMGNEKVDEKRYPAFYSETIAVGSSDPDDQRSTSFNNSSLGGSNFGSHIDIIAPGNFILGLNRVPGSTTVWAGTSMSSAVACGVASLLLSVDSTLKPDQLLSLLISTAKDEIGNNLEDPPGWDPYYGFGRIDAYQAAKKLMELRPSENLFNLSISPNPTINKILNIDLTLGNLDPIKVEIMNAQGKVIKAIVNTPESRTLSFDISLSDHSSALYFVKVITSQKIHQKRFILH